MGKISLHWFRVLIPDIEEFIRDRKWEELKKFLENLHPSEIEEILEDLKPRERALIFRLLPKDKAADVLSEMSKHQVEELIEILKSEEVREILNEMDPDDRVRILDELPASLASKILKLMDKSARDEIMVLMGYPLDSAGHRMRPEFAHIKAEDKVKEAIERLRKKNYDEELLRTIFVTDKERKLVGRVPLARLILSEPDKKVEEVMDKNPIAVFAGKDQEEAMRILMEHDLITLPVVDSEGRLIGVLSVDDIMDIAEEEATEDIHKLGGLKAPSPQEEYFKLSLLERIKKRVPWLISLLILEIFTANVLKGFEKLLSNAVFLSYFIPMLVGTGGNTGTQSVTLSVRSLALGEIEVKKFFKLFFREILTGIGLGLILGIVGSSVAFFILKDLNVSKVIFLALFCVIEFSNLLGLTLPVIFKLIKIDPAVSSSPLITTVVDIGGLFIYLSIAYIFLF